ncbi:MAG: type II toxin-antitoxin system Phd/YefM family antitoxin [Calditrichaeota bacterium]|nr:MAG: type II toxin-antitoxin system Phd/YefM family antitoxin [Calditrichota bacterium]MBL1207003.1 type II toxin-antitoxin system Phd/YefM family antitoxin [Calditrichota bacterium]NOG46830.1 type II toxin-antitoxin system Phd/YefM family antitoxin [Calditrichota bacterium]
MGQINLEQDIKPLSEFRANTAALVKQVKETQRPLIITQHGKSSAVLLDVKKYQSLLDKIEILQDVQLAEKQLDEGKGIGHLEARKRIHERYSG